MSGYQVGRPSWSSKLVVKVGRPSWSSKLVVKELKSDGTNPHSDVGFGFHRSN
jgi:hypothetical protein